ncbi:MAG: hypothetical protein ACQR33_01105 [Candidatus Saccharibacteria bacterium]
MTENTHSHPGHAAWQTLTKVPKITAYFWIIKILTTGMGEATSDYLAHKFNPILAGGIGLVVFVIALVLQLKTKHYKPWVYWFAVAMVAVFGTMAADGLHVELGVPYVLSTLFYAVSLAVIFVAWYKFEGTLSVHSIHTRRRELFYWATVLATFAMGTALGDLTAYNTSLGYLGSGLLFAGIFALPGIGYRLFNLNSIFSFWFAYIITRPLGASFADWMGVPKNIGGLDIGRGVVSLALTVLIIGFVAYVSYVRSDAQSRA